MHSKQITPDELKAFLFKDLHLCLLALPDYELEEYASSRDITIQPHEKQLGIFEGSELVAVMRYNQLTGLVIDAHCYVASKYHKTGKIKQVNRCIVETVHKWKNITNICVPIPASCTHVIKAAKKCGYKQSGYIAKGIIWRKQVVGLYFYTIEVK